MHDAYIGECLRRTKITRKASDMAENLQLYRVVRFFCPRSSCMTHISADVQRITLNASSWLMISGGRTKQLDIIAGFLPRHWLKSDFLSFIVVEHIWFFHGAVQFTLAWRNSSFHQ